MRLLKNMKAKLLKKAYLLFRLTIFCQLSSQQGPKHGDAQVMKRLESRSQRARIPTNMITLTITLVQIPLGQLCISSPTHEAKD